MLLNNYVSPINYMDENNELVDNNYFFCITDRTQEDVDRVKYLTRVILAGTNTESEWKEFQLNLRGALNYSDLDRIERNLNTLSILLNISLVSMERPAIPRISYFNNLLENVRRIRTSFYCYSNTPAVPSRPLNTYQKINDIEKILRDAYSAYCRNTENYFYCGDDVYAGEYMLL